MPLLFFLTCITVCVFGILVADVTIHRCSFVYSIVIYIVAFIVTC